MNWSSRRSGHLSVLVAAADPGLERLALVPSARRPVEDGVVAHQKLDAAPGGRIGLVDDIVLEREDGCSKHLRDVADEIGPGLLRVATGNRWELVLRGHRCAHLLLVKGGAEVEVEVAVRRRGPRDAPAQSLLVGQ